MCGFAAILSKRGKLVRVEQIEPLSAAMLERGPDGEGSWASDCGTVVLAHRRLAIIDLSDRARQPMHSESGKYTLVFNGEIYNFLELRDKLVSAGHRFRTGSDTEVILALFECDGKSAFSQLRGMFSLAIWNNETKELILARDPFGIKPLYVGETADYFIVASQVKSLLEFKELSREVDCAGIVGFYLFGSVPEPFTIFREIRAFPPGHFLSLRPNSAFKEPTPFLTIPTLVRDIDPVSCSEPRSRFLEQVQDSALSHLVSDVPISLFLSAGVDSCALASIYRGRNVQAHTLSYEARSVVDEAEEAQRFSSGLGLAHRTHLISDSDFTGSLEDILKAMDQPSIDGVNTYFVSRAASLAGAKVAISGLGGDELLMGYNTFRRVKQLQRFKRLSRPWIGPLVRKLTARLFSLLGYPKHAGILEYSSDPASSYLLLRSLMMPWELPAVLPLEVCREGLERLQVLERLRSDISGIGPVERKVQVLETCWYMRNQLLRDCDWASMAHSIELRVPLVDVRLFTSLASRLPHEYANKSDLGIVAELPSYLLSRSKSGFSIPVQHWCKNLTTQPVGPTLRPGLRSWSRFVMTDYLDRYRGK